MIVNVPYDIFMKGINFFLARLMPVKKIVNFWKKARSPVTFDLLTTVTFSVSFSTHRRKYRDQKRHQQHNNGDDDQRPGPALGVGHFCPVATRKRGHRGFCTADYCNVIGFFLLVSYLFFNIIVVCVVSVVYDFFFWLSRLRCLLLFGRCDGRERRQGRILY